VVGKREIRHRQLFDDPQGSYKLLEIKGGSTISKSVENSLWKGYEPVARRST